MSKTGGGPPDSSVPTPTVQAGARRASAASPSPSFSPLNYRERRAGRRLCGVGEHVEDDFGREPVGVAGSHDFHDAVEFSQNGLAGRTVCKERIHGICESRWGGAERGTGGTMPLVPKALVPST